MNILTKYRIECLSKRLQRPNANYDDILIQLVNIGPEAIPSLLELSKSENSLLRISVANTLGMIRNDEAVDRLVYLLYDEDLRVRKVADSQLDKLGWQPNYKSVARYYFALCGDNSVSEKKARPPFSDTTIAALLNIKDASAIPLLLRLLKSPDVYDRILGCQFLGNIGDPSVIPSLIGMIHDSNTYVRYWATVALGEIGDPLALEGLGIAIEDWLYPIRREAARALGKIKNVAAIPLLEKKVTDPFPEVRIAVVLGLSSYGARAIHGLEKALLDQSWHERVVGIRGDPNDNRIVEELKNQYGEVRQEAARALGAIGNKHAIKSLRKALTDQDDKLRGVVVEILDNLNDSASIDYKCEEYCYAKKFFNKCPRISKSCLDVLLPMLLYGDKNVREGVANALEKMEYRPKNDKYGAAYYLSHKKIGKYGLPTEEYEKCIEIGPRAIDAILTIWRNDNYDIELHDRMYKLLRKFDKRAIPKLRNALITESGFVRMNIARILDNDFKWKPSPDIYGAAFDLCLGKFNLCATIGVPAVEVVLSIVRDDFEDVCAYYMDGIFQGVDVPSKMNKWLSSLRNVIVTIGENAIPRLLEALKSPARRVRIFAANALDDLKWEPTNNEYEAYYIIVKGKNHLITLGDPFQFGNKWGYAEERSKSIVTHGFHTTSEGEKYIAELKRIGASAIKVLKIMANDADYRTRESAVMALGYILC